MESSPEPSTGPSAAASGAANVPEPRPQIAVRALGMWQTNCHVVSVPGGPDPKGCWIVDCGQRPQALITQIRDAGLTPRGILLTHCHLDHIMGIDEALAAFGPMPILCHPLEREWNENPVLNLSAMGAGLEVRVTAPTALVEDGAVIDLCGSHWKALHVPGHSPGSLAFVHLPSRQAISGDVLFAGGIGRFDFPSCSRTDLQRSVTKVMMSLPDDLTIFPGHGPTTTIGRERRTNPYVLHPTSW